MKSSIIYNVEFFNRPNGDVMFRTSNQEVHLLTPACRDIIEFMISAIADRHPAAHERLVYIYQDRRKNRLSYEFLIVTRFIRCNFC